MTAIFVVLGLVIIGLVLLVIEILIVPGFGVVGILGGIGILSAGYVAFNELNAAYAGLTLAGGLVGAGLLLWLLPRTKAAQSMVLRTQTDGSVADPALQSLLGRQGVTITPLRPSGAAEIDDRPVDVISDGQYIDTGTAVKVVQVQGNRVMVDAVGSED